MKLNIITLFPEIVNKHLEFLPFKKAISTKVLQVNVVDLKKFSVNNYGSVDDKPYGGGTGMILSVEPIYNALQSIKSTTDNAKTVLMSPKGTKYDQNMARGYSELQELTLICGRYEGIDERVMHFCDERVSIGNYVLSGGELPALVIAESITRLLDGVLEVSATLIESFSDENASQVEFPQYTRPEEFMGLKVPEVLLSGDHKKIDEWREKQAKKASK
jgi:tRNA (guanine37-N1)-methyltransferase